MHRPVRLRHQDELKHTSVVAAAAQADLDHGLQREQEGSREHRGERGRGHSSSGHSAPHTLALHASIHNLTRSCLCASTRNSRCT